MKSAGVDVGEAEEVTVVIEDEPLAEVDVEIEIKATNKDEFVEETPQATA